MSTVVVDVNGWRIEANKRAATAQSPGRVKEIRYQYRDSLITFKGFAEDDFVPIEVLAEMLRCGGKKVQ